MSGTLIPMPTNGATNWEDFPDIVQEQGKEFSFISLTNWSSTTIPQVEAGSRAVVNYAMYEFTANETISGLSAMANDTVVYFKIVPAGSTCTVSAVSTDGSSWNADKGGYYDGNDKYIGGCYKDSSGNYINKWVLRGRSRELDIQKADTEGRGAGYITQEISGKGFNSFTNNEIVFGQNINFTVKKPLTAYMTPGFVPGSTGALMMVQKGATYTTLYKIPPNTTRYGIVLNPGVYRGAFSTNYLTLHITGVYGSESTDWRTVISTDT